MSPGDRVVLAGTTGPEGTVLTRPDVNGYLTVEWDGTSSYPAHVSRLRRVVQPSAPTMTPDETEIARLLIEILTLSGSDVSGIDGDTPEVATRRMGGLRALAEHARDEVREMRETYDHEVATLLGRIRRDVESLADAIGRRP